MQNDKIKEYWEGEAGIYSEGIKAELQSETAENWKNLILEYAPEKEHLEVLDVGCGPGFFEITLGKEGHHVTGIDITENMIHEAKENVKAAGLSADLMTMDCHNLNFPDETFDTVSYTHLDVYKRQTLPQLRIGIVHFFAISKVPRYSAFNSACELGNTLLCLFSLR